MDLDLRPPLPPPNLDLSSPPSFSSRSGPSPSLTRPPPPLPSRSEGCGWGFGELLGFGSCCVAIVFFGCCRRVSVDVAVVLFFKLHHVFS